MSQADDILRLRRLLAQILAAMQEGKNLHELACMSLKKAKVVAVINLMIEEPDMFGIDKEDDFTIHLLRLIVKIVTRIGEAEWLAGVSELSHLGFRIGKGSQKDIFSEDLEAVLNDELINEAKQKEEEEAKRKKQEEEKQKEKEEE